MLTIAATWDLKYNNMDDAAINTVITCLQRPETGKLIRLIDSGLNLDKNIIDIFDSYKEGRNLRFGHTTFDEFEARRLNSECETCWDSLMNLGTISDSDSDLIRKLYQEDNDFYYIVSVKSDGNMLVRQFGNKNGSKIFKKPLMMSRLKNRANDIVEGDLFVMVGDYYVKVSPFIQFSNIEQLFMMLIDIETLPLAFKMAYVYRTQYASESVKYLDEFPLELKEYFPEETKKTGKNGVVLNRFSQYDLFEQEYYQGIHRPIQDHLDEFVKGNMAYGAVRGLAGVGKTSAVFMWMNRVLNNEDGILDTIRTHFNLRRIIFLSAKTKIYSRDINTENLSNFYEIESDVSNYQDIVEYIYAVFHLSEKVGTTFEDKVEYIKNYSNNSHGILIIIDDYESLSAKSREKIQKLKDFLQPHVIKMLITTRFPSKESKNIIVERLGEDDCAGMTDHIFGAKDWRNDITEREIHSLTGGLPLLIWYAKAYYQTGQLSTKRLKSRFSGPAEGLEGYLYDNFVQCFDDQFTKNFLMIATRYYELHNVLQISNKTAFFLCLKDPKDYKIEDEEFYFQELLDLKLISINQTTGSVDFSPLMTYMDKSTKRQEPQSGSYQEDNLKLLAQLDEEHYKGLNAVIEAAEFLEDEIKCRILQRVVDFAQDNNIRIVAIRKIFALSDNKMGLYEENINIFQNNYDLVKAMILYLLKDSAIVDKKYEIVRDFVYSISVSMEIQGFMEQISASALDLVIKLIESSLQSRDNEEITNAELDKRSQMLRELAIKFISAIQDHEEHNKYRNLLNEYINEIAIFCTVEKI